MIAAAIAKKNEQKKRDSWNLPPAVWRVLTREQQKLWSDLREAARVRGTKSGTPPFKLQPGNENQYGGINRQKQSAPNSNSNHRAN